jgi:RNA polymerase sigma-70 factor (ECF subfamily)
MIAEANRAGRSEELEITLDRFLSGVQRRALVMAELSVGNRDDALDAVQDAMDRFVRAYAHKPASEWAPLFHRVLQNRIRDGYRRQATARRRFFVFPPDEDGGDPLAALPGLDSHQPDRQLEQTDATERLLRGIAELPQRQQQAVTLRIWEGLDVAQTAQAMGCSAGSVKTHLSRGLQALRVKLEGYWQ